MRKAQLTLTILTIGIVVYGALYVLRRPSDHSGFPGRTPLPEKRTPVLVVHSGFQLKQLLGDGKVEHPTSAAWDANGRLWVIENRTNVFFFQGDSTEVLGSKQQVATLPSWSTGLIAIPEGLIISAAPNLWFIDTRTTNKPLVLEDLVKTAGVPSQDGAVGYNVFAGLDNWIYTAGGTCKFHRENSAWVFATTIPKGIHDLTQDSYGTFFFSDKVGQLRCELSKIQTNITVKKALIAGAASFHVPDFSDSVSLLLYRGGALGAPMDKSAFLADGKSGTVRRLGLNRSVAEGLPVVSITLDAGGKDFIVCTNGVFRPTQLSIGPEGSLYIVDQGSPENSANGGIYRVWKEAVELQTPVLKSKEFVDVQLLGNENSWIRDMVQRSFIDTKKESANAVLSEAFTQSGDPLLRLHALLALAGRNEIAPELRLAGLRDENPAIALWSLRLSESALASEQRDGFLSELFKVARGKTIFSALQLQIFALLSVSPSQDTLPIVTELMARGLHGDFMFEAAVKAAAGHEAAVILKLVSDPRCAGSRSHEELMRVLSLQCGKYANAESLQTLVSAMADMDAQSDSSATAIFQGIARGLPGRTNAENPVISPQIWSRLESRSETLKVATAELRAVMERNRTRANPNVE